VSLTPGGRALGYKEPRVPHKYLMRYRITLGVVPLPQRVDISSLLPSIFDQGSLGSCTACSARYAVGALVQRQKNDGVWVGPSLELAPLGTYELELARDGVSGQDVGASLADCVAVLSDPGCISEADDPYDTGPGILSTQPTPAALANAAKCKLADSAPLDHDIDTVRALLAQGYPVQFAIRVFPSFENASSGVVPMPGSNEQPIGGHALCFVGYDDIKQAFRFVNSWSAQWGDGGFGWLPYGYVVDDSLCYELYAYRRLQQS
jgi:C1A family cysteine protease